MLAVFLGETRQAGFFVEVGGGMATESASRDVGRDEVAGEEVRDVVLAVRRGFNGDAEAASRETGRDMGAGDARCGVPRALSGDRSFLAGVCN